MFSIQRRARSGALALAALAACAAAPTAHAVTYALKAMAYSETQPDGSSVTMWGYRASGPNPTGADIAALAAATSGATSPGPALVVPPGDTQLDIVLVNGLPGGRLTSLVVHGLVNGADPVFATSAEASGTVCTPGTGSLADQRACRLRSLTAETANGGQRTYSFSNVAPGTYLYQSGTHQQVQVQMGLYGMMNKDAQASGAQRYAYGSTGALTTPFDNETRLIFSEIDQGMHALIAGPGLPGSTLGYQPNLFRLHHYPAPAPVGSLVPVSPIRLSHLAANTSNQVINIVTNQRQLVRLVNAGLTTRIPALRDGHMTLVAEDAKPYPYGREQSVALLAAAKTMDAVFVSTVSPQAAASPNASEREVVLYDRRGGMFTTTDGRLNGDFVRLRQGPAGAPPALSLSSFPLTAAQGVLYSPTATATGTPPFTYSLLQAPAGMTINAGTGQVSWTPTDAQAQKPGQLTLTHPVTVQVVSGTGGGAAATVNVAVINADDLAVAVPDTYTVTGGRLLLVPLAEGVLANDFDPDGGALSNAQVATPPSLPVTSGNFVLNTNGRLSLDVRNQSWFTALSPTASRTLTFTYTVQSPSSLPPNPLMTSLPGTVTMIVNGHQPPQANTDTASYTLTPTPIPRPWINIDVLANDTAEAGWSLRRQTLQVVGTPSSGGTAQAINPATNGACTATSACVIRYRPANGAVRGSESFSYRVRDNFGATVAQGLWSNVVTVVVNIQ